MQGPSQDPVLSLCLALLFYGSKSPTSQKRATKGPILSKIPALIAALPMGHTASCGEVAIMEASLRSGNVFQRRNCASSMPHQDIKTSAPVAGAQAKLLESRPQVPSHLTAFLSWEGRKENGGLLQSALQWNHLSSCHKSWTRRQAPIWLSKSGSQGRQLCYSHSWEHPSSKHSRCFGSTCRLGKPASAAAKWAHELPLGRVLFLLAAWWVK